MNVTSNTAQEIKNRFYHLSRENREEAARLLMGMFSDLVNVMGSDDDVVAGLLDGFIREHRTLQQSITRSTLSMFVQWAEMVKLNHGRYVDLRNEDAASWAKSLLDNEQFVYNGKANMRNV